MEGARLIKTGRIIQEKRMEAGFTQKSFANALHITDKAVSKWERGICLPDVALLLKHELLLDVALLIPIAKSIKQQHGGGLIDIKDIDIAFRQGIMFEKELLDIAEEVFYGDVLREIVNHKSVER